MTVANELGKTLARYYLMEDFGYEGERFNFEPYETVESAQAAGEQMTAADKVYLIVIEDNVPRYLQHREHDWDRQWVDGKPLYKWVNVDESEG